MGGCPSRAALQIQATAPENKPDDYAPFAGPGPWYTCMPNGEKVPQAIKSGLGARVKPQTIPELMTGCLAQKGHMVTLSVERPCPPLGADGKTVPPALPLEEWTSWTLQQYHDEVRAAAMGFIKYGMEPFGSVNIWGFNAPEWHMGALAAMFAGGKVAGIYPTDTADTAAYKVVHSGGSVLLFEDLGKIKKIVKSLEARGDCKRVKAFVTWGYEPKADEKVAVAGCGDVPILSWKTLVAEGRQCDKAALDQRLKDLKPGNCAALIYTSGTTGEPKAVMISHDSFIYESSCVVDVLSRSVGLGRAVPNERVLSYLPLSHVAGMMVDIMAPLVGMAQIPSGHLTTFFARPYDMKAGSIKDRLCAARPTLFLGVPLVWEKIADKIRGIAAKGGAVTKTVGTYAKSMGLQHSKACLMGGDGAKPLGYDLVDAVILRKIKAQLGLDQCRFGFTGAAPIRVDTLEYFGSLGLQINEVYGMSECCGACTWSIDQAHMWGSCGWELPGTEVRAFRVDEKDMNKKTECPRAPDLETQDEEYQGELCFRSRSNMMGYLANPDFGAGHVKEIEEKTREAIDNEGWLHSGDKGMISKQGMVKITGRYKELIIGEGGENIAPVPIEDCVKKSCDGIAECMMIGDKRKYNVAFITLKAVGANGDSPGTDDLDAGAKRINPEITTISAAMDDKVIIDAITEAITKTNSNEKVCHNNTFKIQKFTILPFNFSQEGGELTPTTKVKRKVIEKKYAAMIDKLYATSGTYIRWSA